MTSTDQHHPPQRAHNLLLDLPGDVWSLINMRLSFADGLMLELVSKSVRRQQRAQPQSLQGRLYLAHVQQNKALHQHCLALKVLTQQMRAKCQETHKAP